MPIAVSVLNDATSATLAEGGADILSLAGSVPGLYVESCNGRYAPRFYIRGLGNVDFDFNTCQPVSVVLDDAARGDQRQPLPAGAALAVQRRRILCAHAGQRRPALRPDRLGRSLRLQPFPV